MSKEVLVLGAGMVGVSTALALQQRGYAVTLVDRKPPGRETSYGNAGFIQREAVQPYPFPRDWRTVLNVVLGKTNDVNIHWREMSSIAPRLLTYWRNSVPSSYAGISQAFEKLIQHCITEHEAFIRAANAEDLIRKTGWMQVYRSPALFEAAAKEAQAIASGHDLKCQILDGKALAAFEPGFLRPLAGAVYWQDPWTASDPGELVERYAALFQQRGGRFVQGDASTLRQTASGWAVQTTDGNVEGAEAILALGPWSDSATRKLGYNLPLFIKRGYHRHYADAGRLDHPLLDVENGTVITPMKRGLRVATGAEFGAIDSPSTPVQLARSERAAKELLELGKPVEVEPWRGARPCTVDMKPVIGPAPKHKGLWFHFGHAHQGFTLGPATARLLAEMMCGERPYVDPAPYAATRFG